MIKDIVVSHSHHNMEGVEKELIRKIARAPPKEAKRILEDESPQLEVTKSLLNILHNLVVVGSIPATRNKRAFFDDHADVVHDLLSPKKSLAWKKTVLLRDTSLLINIATACPFVDL